MKWLRWMVRLPFLLLIIVPIAIIDGIDWILYFGFGFAFGKEYYVYWPKGKWRSTFEIV